MDAETVRRLGDGVALLGDELDGLDLELLRVGESLVGQAGPPEESLHS